MNIHKVYAPFLKHFRSRRMKKFLDLFSVTSQTRVLDVGGNLSTWLSVPVPVDVTMVNISVENVGSADCRCVIGDGRQLPFATNAFDIVFSNSVIEHLGSWEGQQRFASEIKRVGRSYYVQTPNRRFFFEPHLLTPFIHFLPRKVQRRLLRNGSTWGLIVRPTQQQCDDLLKEIRFLSKAEMKELFADGVIVEEKVAGMTKSIMAVKMPPRPAAEKTHEMASHSTA
jgi:SAM-dependent methyltransferase